MSGRGFRPTAVRRDVPQFVYRCYDDEGVLLYVGCSNAPFIRVSTHRANAWWGDRIARVRYTVFPTREKALDMERLAIWSERPICNVKSRWQQGDPRADWTADDYAHFHTAILRAATVIGAATTALLERVVAEADARFGIDLKESA